MEWNWPMRLRRGCELGNWTVNVLGNSPELLRKVSLLRKRCSALIPGCAPGWQPLASLFSMNQCGQPAWGEAGIGDTREHLGPLPGWAAGSNSCCWAWEVWVFISPTLPFYSSQETQPKPGLAAPLFVFLRVNNGLREMSYCTNHQR